MDIDIVLNTITYKSTSMIFRVSRHCYDVIIYLIFLRFQLIYNKGNAKQNQ
jgi:hypothetical protein